jgi:hypothetical protein
MPEVCASYELSRLRSLIERLSYLMRSSQNGSETGLPPHVSQRATVAPRSRPHASAASTSAVATPRRRWLYSTESASMKRRVSCKSEFA